MTRQEQYARAFIRQANADFDTYRRLCRTGEVPLCHRLQFLQMSCEKLSKADLCRRGSDPDDLATSHAYIASTLPMIAREFLRRHKGKSFGDGKPLIRLVGLLAREIELLAPAVRAGEQRRDNCEYPWQDRNGDVRAPVDHDFSRLNLLGEPVGVFLVKDLLPRTFAELMPR